MGPRFVRRRSTIIGAGSYTTVQHRGSAAASSRVFPHRVGELPEHLGEPPVGRAGAGAGGALRSTSTEEQAMKAIRVHAFGGNDALVLEELPEPTPGEGEVVVRIRAAGVNPVDWKIVRGYLANALPHALPFVPGWDLAGEVVARGHGARRFQVGDRVYGYVRRPKVEHGTYAEAQAVPECYLAAMPAKASFAEAGAIPLVYLTSLQTLSAAGAGPGKRVLVLGASGGTGGAAVELARVLGATEVAGVASPKNHAYVKSLGATATYDYAGASEAGIPGVPAGAFDVIVDCIGGATFAGARAALAEGGHVVSITARQSPAFADLGERYHYVFVEPSSRQLKQLARWFDEGAIAAHVGATYPLARAAEAHAASEVGHTRGKIVLTMD
jgi:NADPH:quinone reductase-like Zn-dependent oxidoreductase